ncbi:MAG: glycosyltransferase [Crocinitomicaceae bacterium]|nr:glycosyltransferase [Crocinitomicaceae bacterium]
MASNKSTQLKIAFFSALPPFRGGISSFSDFLVRALKRKALIEAFTFSKQYPKLLFPGKTQLDSKASKRYPQIITSYNPLTYISARKQLRKVNSDVFIANYWMPFFAPMYIYMSKSFGKNVFKVALIHNLTPHEPRFFDGYLNRLFIKQFDVFIVLSEKVKQDVLSYRSNANCLVLPHPKYKQFGEVQEKAKARALFSISENSKVLLFFGLIRDYKGLDVLLAAMKHLDESFILLIAGEVYGDKNKYLKQIAQISEGRVLFHDRFISDDDVSNYFSAADCCVLPYKAGTQSGIQAIAASFNLPVLVSTNGGLHEQINEGQNGFILDHLNEEAVANKIENVFSGGKLQIVEEFLLRQNEAQKDEWSEFADQFLNFISFEKSK